MNKSQTTQFKGQEITEGSSLVLSKIQFNAGSSVLTPDAKSELDQIYQFLSDNENVQIELDGYTSWEGDPNVNTTVSLQRVESCKNYLVSKGIDGFRIFTIGYGPKFPVAPNDTEINRAKNRRVEMKITKI